MAISCPSRTNRRQKSIKHPALLSPNRIPFKAVSAVPPGTRPLSQKSTVLPLGTLSCPLCYSHTGVEDQVQTVDSDSKFTCSNPQASHLLSIC
ncbi:hypothetical protein TNIN_421871 [Trichonephila inaurata madagascariensis]|uniref:Uncharacterized protein n=1 Tax=Trichonephila inaurata madagascariensis TaxID=2747483 RepID=A0A8X7CBG6_9ARAC|nr:hypothetical protein TNIN_421871 [Trichonephila inaurata madagascariensis]